MASRRNPVVARTWLNAMPAVLVVIGLLLISKAVPQLNAASQAASSRTAPSPNGLQPAPVAGGDPQKVQQRIDDLARQVADLAQKRDALKDRLDAVSQQATQNQWLLSVVLGAAGLLTLAQGVFAFFSAQTYVKQADEAVKKIETLAEEVRAKYPMFSRIEDARQAAFRRLADLAGRLNVDQNLYKTSDPITRQEILSLESFAATQFLASADHVPEVIGNLRLLGKFYADKYLSSGRAIEGDFERALYYYSLELDKSNRDFCALNDLGWLYMEVANPRNPDRAQALLLESLRINANQQRPLYNLGTMSFDPKDVTKLKEARQYFERAVGIAKWEKAPNEEFASHLYYNLACTYSRLAQYEQHNKRKVKLVDLAAGALDKAAEEGGTDEKTLESDLTTGDLVALATSTLHSAQVLAIAAKFGRAWAARASG